MMPIELDPEQMYEAMEASVVRGDRDAARTAATMLRGYLSHGGAFSRGYPEGLAFFDELGSPDNIMIVHIDEILRWCGPAPGIYLKIVRGDR
jgi:hypothetical protein